jgi:hypothetical protein
VDNFSSMPEYYWPYNHTGMFGQQRQRDQRNEVTPSVLTMDEALPVDRIKSSRVVEELDTLTDHHTYTKNIFHAHGGY